jgi:hypothetical protein
MKHFVLSFCLVLVANLLFAQQGRFVFIQEMGRRPFYVRMEDNSFSSSQGGHLILSSLKDSTYNMYIGFPRAQYPEQLFSIKVEGKDRGFELKNMDGQWQLYDMMTMQYLKPARTEDRTMHGQKREDAYTLLMAGVVDDTAVLYASSEDHSTKKDSTAVVPVPGGPVYDKRDIIRYSTENIVEGKLMIYLDRSGPVIDTIRLIIPRL